MESINTIDKKSRKGISRKSNGEGSIFKRSDGRWAAQIQTGLNENNKPIIKTFYGKQRKDVIKKLDEYKLLISTKLQSNKSYNEMTVDEYILRWLTTVRINDLKPTSYDRLECTIKTHIITKIGDIKLSELNSQQIQQLLINKMQSDNLSYSSIKKAYNAINACYKYAITNRHIEYNPVDAVVLPSTNKFENKDIRWFEDDEIKRFKENCIFQYKNNEYKYPLGYGMIFIMNTGLRLGEALALKWSNIDFENKTVNVIGNVVNAIDRNSTSKKRTLINQNTTKSKSGQRIIPLNKNALDSLKKLKAIRYFGENTCILSTGLNTPNKPRNFTRTFEAIIKSANIEPCGIHTLRHTFASQLFKNNVDIKTISILLGHADVAITYNTYIHLAKNQTQLAVEAIDF